MQYGIWENVLLMAGKISPEVQPGGRKSGHTIGLQMNRVR